MPRDAREHHVAPRQREGVAVGRGVACGGRRGSGFRRPRPEPRLRASGRARRRRGLVRAVRRSTRASPARWGRRGGARRGGCGRRTGAVRARGRTGRRAGPGRRRPDGCAHSASERRPRGRAPGRRRARRRGPRAPPERAWARRPVRAPAGAGAAADAARRDGPLEAVEACRQALERGVGVGPGEPDERHLEGDARVGRLAHVDAAHRRPLRAPGCTSGRLSCPAQPSTTGALGLGQVARAGRPCARGTRRAGWPSSASPSTRGSRPAPTASATATQGGARVARRPRRRAGRRPARPGRAPRRRPPPGRAPRACRGPSPRRPHARSSTASASTSSPASAMTHCTCSASSSAGSRWNSKCWVRLRMVGSTFCGSVVASTNTTWSGGSSSVFSSAFDAAGRQHVDLVEDVHLGATRRAERRLADEVAHGVDAVVGGRVELVQVVRGARLDRQARVAHAAGLAVLQVGAVERLGQDAGGRRLARAAWAAEQVGVADALARAPRSAAPAPRGPGRAPRRSGAAGSGGRATGKPSDSHTTDPGQRRNPPPEVATRRSAAHRRLR